MTAECECRGTWREPCGPCYQAVLRERAARTEPTAAEVDEQLARAGLPADARRAVAGVMGATEAATQARAFFNAEPRSERILALLGPAGKGKTVAAGWLMQQVLKARGWNNVPTGELPSPVAFVEAYRLTGASERDKLDADWLDDLRRVRLLVLDDAGDEATPTGVSILGGLLKHRYGAFRRTVITSNLRKEAFFNRYGLAIADRVEASRIVELAGKSLRQKGRQT